jgi:hypothetical protein
MTLAVVYFVFMKTTFSPSRISMRLSAYVPQQPLAERERWEIVVQP